MRTSATENDGAELPFHHIGQCGSQISLGPASPPSATRKGSLADRRPSGRANRLERDAASIMLSAARRGSKPTMLQVAALAHVSPKTVRRVMNADSPVLPRLRSRVQAAVEHRGYHRNLDASSLSWVDGRSSTIGLLLRDITRSSSSTL